MIARAFALCAALAVAACSGSKTPDARPNVLLITLDTVRADRLGCYGYARARTPNLDALAKRGVRFERAYATVPYTLPAHASILTGLYPPAHGLHVNFQGSVPAEAQSVAAGFQAAGYRTGALVASGVLDRRFGLARGFDSYDDLHDRPLNQSSQVERPGSEVSAAAVKWLEQASSHDPYEPPEGFRDFAEPYDGEIAFVDVQVGRLVAALERLGKLANTWIVVVADHGEAFGEHGEFGHGLLVYDSTMHVPLIVAGPAPLVAGGVVPVPVSQVDIAPTLFELLGLPLPGGLEGHSLLPELRGEPTANRSALLECEHSLRSYDWAPLYGIVSGDWKFIQAPSSELYDLVQDRGEEHDLAQAQPEVRSGLDAELKRRRAHSLRRIAEAVHMGADTRDVISKLGYTAGVDAIESASQAVRKDPKLMVHVDTGAVRARALLRANRYAEVLALLKPLLEESPESEDLWVVRGAAELGLNQPKDAIVSFENSLRRAPDHTERLRFLGDALAAAGRGQEALAKYQRSLELDPQDGQTHGRLGVLYANQGQLPQALHEFERFVELDPTSPNARTNLANAQFAQGRFDEGFTNLATAVKLDPTCMPAWQALYSTRKSRGQRAEAIAALRSAAAALPREPSLRARLAWELATNPASSKAEADEALKLAREGLEGRAQDPAALNVLAVALARTGQYAEAAETCRLALDVARAQQNTRLAQPLESQLALFEAGKPYDE
jgi:arylsulfatase A-like enzyme/Flp pilus assembly protein TadD